MSLAGKELRPYPEANEGQPLKGLKWASDGAQIWFLNDHFGFSVEYLKQEIWSNM